MEKSKKITKEQFDAILLLGEITNAKQLIESYAPRTVEFLKTLSKEDVLELLNEYKNKTAIFTLLSLATIESELFDGDIRELVTGTDNSPIIIKEVVTAPKYPVSHKIEIIESLSDELKERGEDVRLINESISSGGVTGKDIVTLLRHFKELPQVLENSFKRLEEFIDS